MPYERRDVPIEQCACPLLEGPCLAAADGEDRLCETCRVRHRPDREAFSDVWAEAAAD